MIVQRVNNIMEINLVADINTHLTFCRRIIKYLKLTETQEKGGWHFLLSKLKQKNFETICTRI